MDTQAFHHWLAQLGQPPCRGSVCCGQQNLDTGLGLSGH